MDNFTSLPYPLSKAVVEAIEQHNSQVKLPQTSAGHTTYRFILLYGQHARPGEDDWLIPLDTRNMTIGITMTT